MPSVDDATGTVAAGNPDTATATAPSHQENVVQIALEIDDNLPPPDLTLEDITDGDNGRGIPAVKFIEDITRYTNSFIPPASAELLIGAYTQLHTKYKLSETSLLTKRTFFGDWIEVCDSYANFDCF
jgi:hypothetical protein